MLPRPERIPRTTIPLVFREGRRFRGKTVSLFYRPNDVAPRASVVSPLKLHKSAVSRNRTKRLLSESLANVLPRTRHADIIVRALTDLSPLTQSETERLLVTDLRASGLL